MVFERRGKKNPWFAAWNNPVTGKRESKSFATKKEAQAHDSLMQHKCKYEPEFFKKKEAEKKGKRPRKEDDSLEAVYHKYLQVKQFSVQSLSWQLNAMRIPLEKLGRKRIKAITTQDIGNLLIAWKSLDARAAGGKQSLGRKISHQTVDNHYRVFKAVMNWAYEMGLLEMTPRYPKLGAVHYQEREVPTMDELDRIYKNAAPHIQRIIALGIYSGARVGQSELYKLTWDAFDMERKQFVLTSAKKNPGMPVRVIPIRDDMLALIQKWKEEDEAQGVKHVIHYRGEPVKSVKIGWTAACRRAGITRNLVPYSLRHGFGTEACEAGVGQDALTGIMGHSDIATTMKFYVRAREERKRAAVNSLPALSVLRQETMSAAG